MDLEARCWALLNLGFKGAIEMSLLIVHLAQDHVVLQEEFVSHTKSRKNHKRAIGAVSVRGGPSLAQEVELACELVMLRSWLLEPPRRV